MSRWQAERDTAFEHTGTGERGKDSHKWERGGTRPYRDGALRAARMTDAERPSPAPEGRQIIAQGRALGFRCPKIQSPKGATEDGRKRTHRSHRPKMVARKSARFWTAVASRARYRFRSHHEPYERSRRSCAAQIQKRRRRKASADALIDHIDGKRGERESARSWR
jgi:hypothetical protein